MNYKLIQTVEGRMIASEFTEENFLAAMEVRGFQVEGFNDNHRQREELIGQPKFKGLAGPMWDGDKIRYEDWASNDALSI